MSGTSVSAKESNKERKIEKHDKSTQVTTVGELMKKMAGRKGWSPKVDGKIASKKIEYEAQTGESDQALAVRVGNKHGAVVTVKQGNLIVKPAGNGSTVSGMAMSPIVIGPGKVHLIG